MNPDIDFNSFLIDALLWLVCLLLKVGITVSAHFMLPCLYAHSPCILFFSLRVYSHKKREQQVCEFYCPSLTQGDEVRL